MNGWVKELVKAGLCAESIEWARQFATAESAWAACDRADWMLWWVGNQVRDDADRRKIALVACQCARLSMRGSRDPHLDLVEVTESWGRHDVDARHVRDARGVEQHVVAEPDDAPHSSPPGHPAVFAASIVNARSQHSVAASASRAIGVRWLRSLAAVALIRAAYPEGR